MAEPSWVVVGEDVDGFMIYIDMMYMTSILPTGNWEVIRGLRTPRRVQAVLAATNGQGRRVPDNRRKLARQPDAGTAPAAYPAGSAGACWVPKVHPNSVAILE